jgi:hypothetical protein
MGRIMEEKESREYNTKALAELKRVYDKNVSEGRANEFENVAQSNDPVIQNAWKILGNDFKKEAKAVFGQDKFLPIRREQVKDVLGYHAGSIRDVITGEGRWSQETVSQARRIAKAWMKDDAYKYMVKAENVVQDAVSYAKTSIIVRGLVVMWQNYLSNALYLLSLGIPPQELLKNSRQKFLEISKYAKNNDEILKLNMDLSSADTNAKERSIKARIQMLTDENNSLSIAPLLEAGEFSTISESLTEQDLEFSDGRFVSFLEKQAGKLPGFAETGVKNLLVTKDTALFQALNRGVQYGDFISKAVLYDHLVQKEGMTEEEALFRVSEEFVNYNKNAGRGRDALESLGLLWFMNYKIRIMKIGIRMARENPFKFMLYASGAGMMPNVETIQSSSALGAIADGSFGYSIGPEMGIDSIGMSPWSALAGR